MEKIDRKIDLGFDTGLVASMRSALSSRILNFFTLVLASSVASACCDVSNIENLENSTVDPSIAHSAKVGAKSRECVDQYAKGFYLCHANALICDMRGAEDDCFVQLDACSRPFVEAFDSCLAEYRTLLTCSLDDELGNKNDPLGNADPDMDGLSAYTEFVAGTDPCNAVSDGKVPDDDRDHDNDGVPNSMDGDISPCSGFGGIGSSGCG